MASIREYLEKLNEAQLQNLLCQEAYGAGRLPLSTIWMICEILGSGDAARGTPRDLFLEFASRYADHVSAAGQ